VQSSLVNFSTSSTLEIEAITRLIPIHLYLQKLSGRHQLRTFSFSDNYIIKSFLKSKHISNSSHHHLSLENMISKQRLQIRSSIINTNNHLNNIFPPFDSLNSKFSPGLRLVDIFFSYFSFHQADHKNKEFKAAHLYKHCSQHVIVFQFSHSYF